MLSLRKGRYVARTALDAQDILAAQALRHRCFRSGNLAEGIDCDSYDTICKHILIEDQHTGDLVCCFRLLPLENGADVNLSYSAQYYELSALSEFEGPMVEIGRFCIDPAYTDPDILRIAWGAMTKYIDENNVEMLFGCSSFQGTEAAQYYDAFAFLRDRHLAPKRFLPQVKSPSIFRFSQHLRRQPDAKRAMKAMPPLLRSYLAMGGWVSDHAVVDQDLGTLHVFTGLEICAIPPARARLLRMGAA